MRTKSFVLPAVLCFLSAASTALAHPAHSPADGIASGFTHPLGGWDHLLAMIAIGLWSAQLGGRACWRVPVVFVGAMACAAIAGHSLGALPWVDQGVAASVFVLGLLIAIAKRLPLSAGLTLAGTFAIFHGLAHGAEMPATTGALAYGAGFTLASLGLHAAGLGIGLLAVRLSNQASRLIGWGVAAAGVAILAS